MLNLLGYLMVIVLNGTIPLVIKLGGDAFTPIAGLSIRVLIAFVIGWLVFGLFGIRLNFRKHAPVYFAASIAIFPNFVLVYTAVEYIPSGLVALLFGLQPFFTAVFMRPILGESGLHPRKMFAIFLALASLALILMGGEESLEVNNTTIGVLIMVASGCLFSCSALWVKRLNRTLSVPPFEQTLGGMVFSIPGLLLSWWLVFGIQPIIITPIAIASLMYLVIIGSLFGLAAYYFILGRMAVETVALIPLITPIVAMVLGVVFLDETITRNMLMGSAMLMVALAIHQEAWRLFLKKG